MTRAQLEHLIRAAGDIAADDEIVVIGSQAILAQFPEAPASLRISVEADLYPKNFPERADLVEGSIGEGSPFHSTFGYYAQAVDETTAIAPTGWQERLVRLEGPGTRGITAWCLEAHDLLIAKLVAGRPKDLRFAEQMIEHGLVDWRLLGERMTITQIAESDRARIAARIDREFRKRSAS